ncbi:multidrug efflux system membrane fusion protein/multidrug efflux system membrane fusion protein/multidrug efflux system membrane fusion protein [Prosthecobacter fusiformis]|uniref:Multidrug efflux system membrane fusion protein/multidrug efflux system membrane fusion protein/multidrug efflux system membrane fusion protein n=1 Tax=Prosthecobacter fusiformis TaxID=48464 RepID=A0A4V3FFF1_9BACT|nr:efflux RND transporter periplasmic adaptor subunit [Prosthecobacter fusiformis]TDU70603.1 multidrug efflux system membrane fusion protein/multidrug efflux system membrane fusion protein/multidrug efflux system membrane fusion protein [Prosthecobacter fusiformis]
MKPQTLLPFVLLLAACGKPPQAGQGGQMPPAPVTIAAVEQLKLVEWEEFTGRVEPVETVELRPRVAGYITEVHFKAGELVKKGDILFTIDQRPFQTKLRVATAEVQRAEASALAAKREYDRVSSLLAAKAIAPEQGEMRESMFRQGEAALESAKASQHSAEIEMEHTEVKAPISGRISRAITTTGNFVTAGTTLLTTIVTVDPVYVYTDIDENSLLRLQALQRDKKLFTNGDGRVPVELQLSNEKTFTHKGHVESFDNRLDSSTGSMILRAEFSNADGSLTPGLFARVRLPMTAEYPALLIDEKSILTDQANKFVLGVDDKNMSVYKPVVIGPSINGKRIIRSGLNAGDKIIINGQARLPQPGMPVAPVDAPPAKATAAN